MKISIIIPTHNKKNYLNRTLSSFCNQNYPLKDTEILVIDDGQESENKKIINIWNKLSI